MSPKIVCCNFIKDIHELKTFAQGIGFDGIDWSFYTKSLPKNPAEESALFKAISSLYPLEVRYHCAFPRTDMGDDDHEKAGEAEDIFRSVCRLVSKLGGEFITMHIGLGRHSTTHLSWERSLERVAELVHFANGLGVRLCLENLGWGWTSRPDLYEKLIRKTGIWATLDIGHAKVSPSVRSQQYDLKDFVAPHPERFVNAHIYDEELSSGHVPPKALEVLEDRLNLLTQLPLCDWWVVELREEAPLLETCQIVRTFLTQHSE
ncbi:MAG: sugar phosphate isomerase/epimerase [Deltaproteobacteria bacterium]|nr:sugar phosphate isomerase/epimerase [Deltaproteobacteria bacterium]